MAGESGRHLGSRRGKLAIAGVSVAVAAVVVVGVIVALGQEPAQPVPVGGIQAGLGPGELEATPGEPVPELSGTNPITGEKVSLSGFKGKPVVINVWASWCPPCRAEAPDIKRFVDAHPEAVMLGIDFQDTPSDAQAFYREFDWTHPSIDDPDGRLAMAVRLFGLPTTIFLDAEHREVARVTGETDFAGLEKGLELAKGAG